VIFPYVAQSVATGPATPLPIRPGRGAADAALAGDEPAADAFDRQMIPLDPCIDLRRSDRGAWVDERVDEVADCAAADQEVAVGGRLRAGYHVALSCCSRVAVTAEGRGKTGGNPSNSGSQKKPPNGGRSKEMADFANVQRRCVRRQRETKHHTTLSILPFVSVS
jgi:hypothetical protein